MSSLAERDIGPGLMSANLDLVRSIYAGWERRDFSRADWAHPEIQLVAPDGPAAGSWTGVSAMRDSWREWLSAWENWRVEAEEYRVLEDGSVLVLVHQSGRGKTSRIEIGRAPGGHATLFQFRDGTVDRLVLYADRNRALADLGLNE